MEIWVDLVIQVVQAEADIPTFALWASLAGKSVGSLRLHCYAIHASPRRTLLFARLLRAVSRGSGPHWDLGEWLHAADPRTLVKAARLGGIPEAAPLAPSVPSFLRSQQLLPPDSRPVEILRTRLVRTAVTSSGTTCLSSPRSGL
jgi:hypothetical protein